MTHIHDDKLFSYAERVKDKVVIITGGASGIGKAAALKFAEYGAKVVIGDLNEVAGKEVVTEIEAAGGKAASLKCNVVSWDDQVALFELAISKYGTVDIVVPNAGIADRADFETVKFENGKPVKPRLITMEVNLTAVLYTIHLSQHYLLINKKDDDLKALILIGSMASWVGIPKGGLYTGSKHAILGVMRALTKPLAFHGIRVACIHPWFADTNILPLDAKLFLAGIPMLPVPRIAGCIVHAATNPDPETNGCAWLLPDDGPVFLVGREDFKLGVYKMIDDRTNAIFKAAGGVRYYVRLFKDLWSHTKPLRNLALLGAVGALAWKNQDKILELVSQ